MASRRSTANSYTPRSRRGGRGRGGGSRAGRGGRGGRHNGANYVWTAGSPASPAGGYNFTVGDDHNQVSHQYAEDLGEYPREQQSGLLFGLPEAVVVPGSVSHSLLQGEILETLKRMPSDIVNLMLKQYDTCAREGGIRNKNAYLLGIINSGPRMGLPQGVVVPPSVKFSLMQGVVLDDLNALSVKEINVILGEFERIMRERGSTIYDKYSFLADLIRKHKPASPKRRAGGNNQYVIGGGGGGAPSHHHQSQAAPPQQQRSIDPRNAVEQSAKILNPPANNGQAKPNDTEMEDTLALLANSLERVQLLTESVAKVTGELVAEKEKRSSQEAIARSEQILREATEERLATALKDLDAEKHLRDKEKQEYQTTLKFESDRRGALEKEVTELKEKIEMERAEKHRAEDRLSVLEEVLISERDVRDQEREDFKLPGFDSGDFDSDDEANH